MDAFALLLLAFKAIALASLPLGAVWIGRAGVQRADRLRRLAWVTAFLTFDLVVFGAFTRLTDSGLGCPDWPGCYAAANPWMAAADIRHAESILPSGPVTMQKAWIEMIHRYLAMTIGLLIIVILATSIVRRLRKARAPAFPGLAALLLAVVVLQGAFGAWTVTQRLQPIFVTMHLLLGLSLLALQIWHALRLGPAAGTGPTLVPTPVPTATLRAGAAAALLLLALQIALGGWVSANYAVLACNDFPTCQGVWIPSMDFRDGFQLWHPLGMTANGGYLSVAALTAIHWTHRTFAWVVFGALGALAWKLHRLAAFERHSVIIAGLLSAQFATGLVNVVFAWPLVAAVLHDAGAAALVATLVVINYRLRDGLHRRLPGDVSRDSAAIGRWSRATG